MGVTIIELGKLLVFVFFQFPPSDSERCAQSGAHNEKGRGGGKEREAPMHLIKNSEHTHAACVTKNRQNHKISSQGKK
jgi:hypothetical protein